MDKQQMGHGNRSFIDGIRASSRQMVRELGFLDSKLAATPYSASAVHALLEIGGRGHMTAFEIAECLNLEKSSVSRMVRKLIDAGELQEVASDGDGRVKELSLTAQGVKTFRAIESYGRKQVSYALERLTTEEAQVVNAGLRAYARALSGQGTSSYTHPRSSIQIMKGYRPGIIGSIIAMLARVYARHPCFGQAFESQVAEELAEFTRRLEHQQNGLWLALCDGRTMGSIAVHYEAADNSCAYIRWFVAEDNTQPYDIESRLLAEALAHCDRVGDTEIRLWAFDIPSLAGDVYAANGFKLSERRRVAQWNKDVTEMLYIRPSNAGRVYEEATRRQPASPSK